VPSLLVPRRSSFHASMENIQRSVKSLCESGKECVRGVAKRLSISEHHARTMGGYNGPNNMSMLDLTKLDSTPEPAKSISYIKRNNSMEDATNLGQSPQTRTSRERKRGFIIPKQNQSIPPRVSDTINNTAIRAVKRHSVAVTDPSQRNDIKDIVEKSAKQQRKGSLKENVAKMEKIDKNLFKI